MDSFIHIAGERLRMKQVAVLDCAGSRRGTGSGEAAGVAFCGFSRGLTIGVSAFLLIADNQNTGTHADQSQAFICGLIPNNQR